jgi:acyl carrier protein
VTDVKSNVREYITQNILLGQQVAGFTDDASFLKLGILDSTAVLEVIGFIEETFGVQVGEADMVPENLDSLDAIDAFVQRKKRPGA